jgi:catechol 2,3-dioxygenase-like lactoylglutathione lyase family enzyme
MSVTTMNHFTVLSDDLEATRRFYCDLFGFRVGWRPPFQFPGWWLYADGDTPILHVIHRDPLPKERAGVLDHMAFTARDLPGAVATLKRVRAARPARRWHLAAVLQRPARRQGRV